MEEDWIRCLPVKTRIQEGGTFVILIRPPREEFEQIQAFLVFCARELQPSATSAIEYPAYSPHVFCLQ